MWKWRWPNLVLFHSDLIPPSSCVHLFVTPRDSPFPLSDRIPSYFLSLPRRLWGSYYRDGKWLLGWHLVTFKEVHLSAYYSSPSWMKSICVAKMACCPLPLSPDAQFTGKWQGGAQLRGDSQMSCWRKKIFNGLSVAFPALTCQVIRNISRSHTPSLPVLLFFIPPLPRAITPC